MKRDEALTHLIDASNKLIDATHAVPVITFTRDSLQHETFLGALEQGQTVTAAREYATGAVLEQSRDLYVARAKVDELRERVSMLRFLIEHDLCD